MIDDDEDRICDADEVEQCDSSSAGSDNVEPVREDVVRTATSHTNEQHSMQPEAEDDVVHECFAGIDVASARSISEANVCSSGKRFSVYCIVCRANQKRYYGVSSNVHERFKQHRRRPPKRMQADVAALVPFEAHFVLHVLPFTFARQRTAEHFEAVLTALHKTQLPAHGYNNLRGRPGYNRKFYAMRSKQARS